MPISKFRDSPYGYTPTEYVCIIFVALFGLSTVIHVGQSIRYRVWWVFPTVILCGALETVGWGGRLWSALQPVLFEPYEIQIVCTIIGPTPLAAANFVILGRIINRLGPAYSRLSPKLYTIIFLCCDIISLVVQAIGGGMAAQAVNMLKNPAKGGNVMLGGITFQMACIAPVTITVYAFCAGEFLVRYLNNWPIRRDLATKPTPLSRNLKVLVSALVFSTLCLFIRAVYRVIELSDGWTGRIIHTQVYFNVLDGMMITLAILTLNVAHPGRLLAPAVPRKEVESTDETTDGTKV
ncbi:RTA1-domain-containing protein [Mycena sanguinolenta]|uniref:RTA1-domain-containing protein n=1 Tax=Mycena sanguinolenta TaxID=230812 RepID=A0A8H6Y0P5_9AGAR|nr:RTA1-domain-containing protein [Mycena sanguinolenta]